jgi:segregation and condensation protein B
VSKKTKTAPPTPPEQDTPSAANVDPEETVNLTGDVFPLPGRDDLEAPTQRALPDSVDRMLPGTTKKHLQGLVEALIFASDHPITPKELARTASAQTKEVKEVLEELQKDYDGRGVQLEEVAGGWIFRTNPVFAPFVRDLTGQKPVKLTRAQIETLAILAYRQPITRPEVDEIRGVDSGPVLKLLLERDLVRILGKKDEPGRPLLYGTTSYFLEFFGLKAVKDLPTLREFTELTEDSKRVIEKELGETLETAQDAAILADHEAQSHEPDEVHDTIAPPDVMHSEAPGLTPQAGTPEPEAPAKSGEGERTE